MFDFWNQSIEEDEGAHAPAIGTRDLAELRMLISIAFKWAVEPLLDRVARSWPAGSSSGIDLTSLANDYNLLLHLTARFMGLIFPSGVQGRMPPTLILLSSLCLSVVFRVAI